MEHVRRVFFITSLEERENVSLLGYQYNFNVFVCLKMSICTLRYFKRLEKVIKFLGREYTYVMLRKIYFKNIYLPSTFCM